jgi:hypothetical protein
MSTPQAQIAQPIYFDRFEQAAVVRTFRGPEED